MKLKLFMLAVAVFALLSAFIRTSPNQSVKGVVKDNKGNAIPNATVLEKGSVTSTVTDNKGVFSLQLVTKDPILMISAIGYESQQIKVSKRPSVTITMQPAIQAMQEVVVTGYPVAPRMVKVCDMAIAPGVQVTKAAPGAFAHQNTGYISPDFNTEEYDAIKESNFLSPLHKPLSTFSIDVDAASYSNIRRFIERGETPPIDAVRIEEMINYFDYDYPQPNGDIPFSVTTEIGPAPWNPKHQLLHVGLQGKEIPANNLPASNLVFLIDVSGSMASPEKLPLLKNSFRLLVEQLRPQDHVAIVVYAGAAGLVLEPTSGNEKNDILKALDQLEAGGSTAGGQGIQLAYSTAKKHFKPGANNRIILATDGDFNVGISDNASMQRLVEEKRKEGIFLTVLGFGMGNYKDSKMEILADKGNGNYAYIDNITEARKVLVKEFGGTLFTIAKDVKLQLEFNPALVQAYRLIGYENRALSDEEFSDDKKDAGEMGAGHNVTALYEIIPVGVKTDFPIPDSLKYQRNTISQAGNSRELVTLKLRYKKPTEDNSQLLSFAVQSPSSTPATQSNNFRWSAAVAEFGMLLRKSEFAQQSSFSQVLALAGSSTGEDKEGYRKEFIQLVQQASKQESTAARNPE